MKSERVWVAVLGSQLGTAPPIRGPLRRGLSGERGESCGDGRRAFQAEGTICVETLGQECV